MLHCKKGKIVSPEVTTRTSQVDKQHVVLKKVSVQAVYQSLRNGKSLQQPGGGDVSTSEGKTTRFTIGNI